jgi:hypothetical protein
VIDGGGKIGDSSLVFVSCVSAGCLCDTGWNNGLAVVVIMFIFVIFIGVGQCVLAV